VQLQQLNEFRTALGTLAYLLDVTAHVNSIMQQVIISYVEKCNVLAIEIITLKRNISIIFNTIYIPAGFADIGRHINLLITHLQYKTAKYCTSDSADLPSKLCNILKYQNTKHKYHQKNTGNNLHEW